MENVFDQIEDLGDNIRQLVNMKVDGAKLSVAEKSSKVLSNLIAGIIVAVIVILVTIFLSIALAYFLAGLLGSTWAGFLIVSGIYLLAALFILAFKEKMIRVPIMNSILSQMVKEEDDDEEED
jgi:ABC-type glycerol-3-phosphate transport system permease component